MSKQFVPLTAEQLASAEKGDLKLEYRGGGKVMQLVWLKEPYDQNKYPLISVSVHGAIIQHCKTGAVHFDAVCDGDLFVCEVQPTKYSPQSTAGSLRACLLRLSSTCLTSKRRRVTRGMFQCLRNFSAGGKNSEASTGMRLGVLTQWT